jgi:hypothetical protein
MYTFSLAEAKAQLSKLINRDVKSASSEQAMHPHLN